MTIDGDTRHFVEEATALCKRATESGVLLLFRNDEEEIIVTNATTPQLVRELGEALAAGYSQDGGE